MVALVRKRTRAPSVEDSDEMTAVDERTVDDDEDEDEEDSEQHEENEEAAQPTWKRNAKFLSRYILRRDDTRKATHSSLVGGRYFIPPEMRKEFYQKYYTEMLSAESPSLFLTERYNNEDFRFFVDVDYDFAEDGVPEHTHTIAKLRQAFSGLWDKYAAQFPPAPMPPTMKTMDLFPCRAASRTEWKLHVIFHKTIVDWQSALRLGQTIQCRLDAAGEGRIKLDMKVYTKGSLRMLGSYKKDTEAKHPRETALTYTPIDIESGEPLEWKDEMIEEYSIFMTPYQKRCVDNEREMGGMVSVLFDIDFGTSPSKGTLGTESVHYTGAGNVVVDSPLYKCIADNCGEDMAKSADKIIHSANTLTVTFNTTYCPLAAREHTSNHPYVVLSPGGMRVKCHSTNDRRCVQGGELIELPSELVASLLPSANSADNSASAQAKADISTIRGQAELLFPEFIADDILVDEDPQNLVILSLSGTHRDVANVVKPQLSDDFVCVDADTQRWYHYIHPLWRYPEAKNDVKVVIGDLPHVYTQYIQSYYKDFEGDDKIRKQRINTIMRVKNKVSDNQFKDKVAKELASMSLDVRFEQMLDENRSLLGFNNGVFDIEKREFREGRTSDMVSMTVGYDYPTQSSPVHRARLDALMEDMQPDVANRNYLKKNLASCLAPGNTFELFHIWSGTTRNGKSVLALLLSIALGSTGYKKEDGEISKYPYACPFEPSFLTSDRSASSSAPAPEVVASRLARVLIGSEPERGQKINSAFVKKLTGNDLLSARLLFSNQIIVFPPRFQLILICNDIPVMDHNEQAVWKRSRVVDFPTTFVDNPQLPNERQIDELLKDKLLDDMQWRKEFMLMLIEWYYDLYLVEGMRNPPACVLKATRAYQEKSVLVGEYWGSCISQVDPGMHKHLCLECILNDFRDREVRVGPENGKKAFEYTQSRLKADLIDTLGVKVNSGQTRCGNCPAKKQGVKNVRFSDARLAEKAEGEMEATGAVLQM